MQKWYGAISNKGSDAMYVRSIGKGRLADQVVGADWRLPWRHQRGESRRWGNQRCRYVRIPWEVRRHLRRNRICDEATSLEDYSDWIRLRAVHRLDPRTAEGVAKHGIKVRNVVGRSGDTRSNGCRNRSVT